MYVHTLLTRIVNNKLPRALRTYLMLGFIENSFQAGLSAFIRMSLLGGAFSLKGMFITLRKSKRESNWHKLRQVEN